MLALGSNALRMSSASRASRSMILRALRCLSLRLCGSSFKQSKWSKAYVSGGCGDISFGTSANSGPTTSWNRLQSSAKNCHSCTFAWPGKSKIYSIGKSTTSFRIGWGECGPQWEGWYPWYQGYIMLR